MTRIAPSRGGTQHRLAALTAILVALFLVPFGPIDAGAQTKDTGVSAATEPPPQVQSLLKLLDDPVVRQWLERQRAAEVTTSSPPPSSTAQGQPMEAADGMAMNYFVTRITHVRGHIAGLAAALPDLPAEFNRAFIILQLEFQERGLIELLVLIAVFAALGFGTELLFVRATTRTRARISELPLDTVRARLRAMMARLAFMVGRLAASAVGSVGAFLIFDWPPLLREIVLGYLLAFLAWRIALVAGRFLLAPPNPLFRDNERFRIIPMSGDAALFWDLRVALAVGWFVFGYVTVELLATLGLSPAARELVAYAFGLGLLAIGIDMAWRRPKAEESGDAGAAKPRIVRVGWLLTVYFVALWLLWVVGAIPLLWLSIVVVGLPATMRVTQRAVSHLLRPPGMPAAGTEAPSFAAICLERGLRALLVLGAALLIARAFQIDLVALTERDTMIDRLVRGVLNGVVILLVADLAWHLLKTLIDRKLSQNAELGPPNTEAARRQARIRTLLPIMRNMLFVVVVVMAGLMVLSALGVQIGPLIAGAGVVGVAVGFGAQTLVKDVISGVFYLLDDAFRIGEYVQSGNYKGTVESFSLRSVKLRHHRGPLYTVPFGQLGAVENMSRDWVIDKLTIGVTYDTDLSKVKKLIKQIGNDLANDPEHASHIIETLKMQGVEQFGDYAIQIRMKMMTRPGEQFVIRRKAYDMIKKAFDANGINFAFPTVQVASGSDPAAAVARQGLELVQPAPAGRR